MAQFMNEIRRRVGTGMLFLPAIACEFHRMASAPKRGRGRKYHAVDVTQPVGTISAEQQWPVEVDKPGLLRNQDGRRHRKRSGDHAPNHECEPLPPSLGYHREGFGQSTGLV